MTTCIGIISVSMQCVGNYIGVFLMRDNMCAREYLHRWQLLELAFQFGDAMGFVFEHSTQLFQLFEDQSHLGCCPAFFGRKCV